MRAREKEVQTRESEIVTEVETLVAQSVKNREAVITKVRPHVFQTREATVKQIT